MAVATNIILIAGSMTFVNEWYQTKEINWRVPIATVLAAAIFDGIAHLNDKAATGLSIIVLIGAFTTHFNGKSVADTLNDAFSKKSPVTHQAPPKPTIV